MRHTGHRHILVEGIVKVETIDASRHLTRINQTNTPTLAETHIRFDATNWYYNALAILNYGHKKALTTIGFDKSDTDFLHKLGILNNSDGIRFAVKMMRLYWIRTIKAIKEKDGQ